MGRSTTAGAPGQGQAWVTAAGWFAGGQRIWYDAAAACALSEEEAAAAPGALRVSERADLVQALWRHHGVRATVVVTFDSSSLALLDLLRSPRGALGMRGWQRSPRACEQDPY